MKNQQAGNLRRRQEAVSAWADKRPEIERLYVNGDWSQERLAQHYNLSLAGMQKVLARMGIPSKSHGRRGAHNGRFRDGTQSTIYRTMIEKSACAKCATTENLCVHHKDEDHTNNVPSNLEVLCMSCHSRMHKTDWWRARAGRS
jgi:hypothetical protein